MASVWCAGVVLVNPAGDFPLNDDWSFGIAVKGLIEEGTFRPTGWTDMTLIAQALWGAAFCMPLGFSFTALRLSTLVLSLLGISSVYMVVRQLERPRWLAVGVALTVAFSPIYFCLSHTFMTDVPFTAFTALAILFLIRSLHLGCNTSLLLGSCIAMAAVLCRQLGLFLPIAYGVALVLKHGVSLCCLLRASLPTVMGVGGLLGFEHWLRATGGMPASYGCKMDAVLQALHSPALAVHRVGYNTFLALLYLGLFLLPVLAISVWPRGEKRGSPAFVGGISLLFVLSAIAAVWPDHLMPSGVNVLHGAGIGPLTLHDTYILHLPHVPPLPHEFWVVVTILSICGAALVVAHVTSIGWGLVSGTLLHRQGSDGITTVFCLSGAVAYSLPLYY